MTSWMPGQQIVRPGTYIRVTNFGDPPIPGVVQGVAAAVIRAPWGPLNQAVTIDSLADIDETFGTTLGTDAPREQLRGGAHRSVVVRAGTGGAKASRTITDTAGVPANVGTITAKHVGTRGNDLRATIRDSLTDATRRELLVYEVVAGANVLRQTILFVKGGGDEMQNLVNAVTTAQGGTPSPWVDIAKTVIGNGILTPLTLQALSTAAGADPAVSGAEYSAALLVAEAQEWNAASLDTNDTTVHASAAAWINRIRNEGKRRSLVLAEPTSIALATRQTNAKAFNHPGIRYVGNGFTGSDGVTRDGWMAAARYAGTMAGSRVTQSLTHAVVAGATLVVGPMPTITDVEASINAGMVFFTVSRRGQIQVEYDLTTFITPTADLDAGWKYGRRQRERDDLLNSIDAAWEPLIGQVNNDLTGRRALRAIAETILRQKESDGALLPGARIYNDPANPPAGDTASFVIEADDIDAAAKIKLTSAFRFAPPAAA